ncbi:TlpA family protein disulfide reductase [Aquimarina sp. LLG6339-5]|uniref:TlpA family protein disulfide reductase n=1 Tax=Aquimarina sp. LLG6339-5 TaxID=3160830 RepID=UPI00386FAC15
MIQKRIIVLIVLSLLYFGCKNKNEATNTKLKNIDYSSLTEEEKINIAAEGNQINNSKIANIDSLLIDTKSFRGKLLVIDFWATWCSPCIKEAPLFKKLAKKYKNKNVEFISISIDSEFSHWKNYILEANWEGNNYWYGDFNQEPFSYLLYSKFTVKNEEIIGISLPKYVIISPNGEILSNSDLRPSKPGLEMEIKKHLK